MFVPSLHQVVGVLQCLWILVNSAKVFPVVILDQGTILVAIRVYDELYAKDPLLLPLAMNSVASAGPRPSALMFCSCIVFLQRRARLWSG